MTLSLQVVSQGSRYPKILSLRKPEKLFKSLCCRDICLLFILLKLNQNKCPFTSTLQGSKTDFSTHSSKHLSSDMWTPTSPYQAYLSVSALMGGYSLLPVSHFLCVLASASEMKSANACPFISTLLVHKAVLRCYYS